MRRRLGGGGVRWPGRIPTARRVGASFRAPALSGVGFMYNFLAGRLIARCCSNLGNNVPKTNPNPAAISVKKLYAAVLKGVPNIGKRSIIGRALFSFEVRERCRRHFRSLGKLLTGPSEHRSSPAALLGRDNLFI
jgi:hypothetical protein